MVKRKSKFGMNTTTKQDLSAIYSGAADVGKVYAYITSIFIIIFAALALALGVYLIRKEPVYTNKVLYTITNVTPTTTSVVDASGNLKQTTTYDLIGTVKMCGDKPIGIPNYSKPVLVGQTIDAWMKPTCESGEASGSSDDNSKIGWGIVGVSIFVIVLMIGRVLLVRRFKAFAAFEGASGASSLASSIF